MPIGMIISRRVICFSREVIKHRRHCVITVDARRCRLGARRDPERILLWHRRVFTGYSARVKGFTPYPDGIIRLQGLRLE